MRNQIETEEFVCSVHDPDGRLGSFLQVLRPALRRQGHYALCIGSTATSDIEWISAAGADPEARRWTPAIDAEALVLGAPKSAANVPVSPRGIVSPVVLSRAMLSVVDCKIDVFDCGAFYPPQVEHERVGVRASQCLQTGRALPIADVENLFESGRRAGRKFASEAAYVIVGECVPAGTTTALGILTALGYNAMKLVSSSMPGANHDKREGLVRQGLLTAGSPVPYAEPLNAVAAVGDPMQPFVAGLMLEASKKVPVVLGGGTQMLAVYALAKAIEGEAHLAERMVGVFTTKWVAFDKSADPASLAKLVGVPFAASCPNFHASRHAGLRAYEEGNVKEGVAAGALMSLAHFAGKTDAEICEAIDSQYEAMVPPPEQGGL